MFLSELMSGEMKDKTARTLRPSIQKVSILGGEPFTCKATCRSFSRCRATRVPSSVATPFHSANPARTSFRSA